jgi:hypothetical protein
MGLKNPLSLLLAPALTAEMLALRDRMEGQVRLPQAGRPRAAYDRLVDALNRLPRPLMALGTVALMAAAMIAPDWFEGRMEALAAVPEALWWLLGAVISLYFGSRLQSHAQDFQREIVEATLAPELPALPEESADTPASGATGTDAGLTLAAEDPEANMALRDWMLLGGSIETDEARAEATQT